MPYQCLACSYTGNRFPGGVCPGCGSAHIANLSRQEEHRPLARKPYRLVLAVVLWLYLLIEIYRRLG